MDSLTAGLKPIRRRLVAVRAVEAGLAGAVVGAVAGAVLTLVRVFLPQVLPVWASHPALPLALLPCGFVAAFVVRLGGGATFRDAALAADRAGHLKERLATALEVLDGTRPGLLDDRLLDQAREAAERLDVQRPPLATSLGWRGRVVLVCILVLSAAAMVPSVGGPGLEPRAAARAALALDGLARDGSLAPAIRAKIEQAVARFRDARTRRGGAEEATSAVYQAVAEADLARRETLCAVAEIDDPDIQRIIRAASGGDGPGAAGAAAGLADRLASDAGSGGMPPEARQRLADSLTGAAAAAGRAELTDLERALAAAADAVRKGDPEAGDALDRLAAALTDAIGEKRSVGVAAVVAAVGQARRTLGLSESVPPAVADAVAGVGPEPSEDVAPAGVPSGIGAAATGAGGAEIPADVRPEDREVVRRYFGG